MNYVAKIFRSFIAGLMLAAFALPAPAAPPPTKQYGLDITTNAPPAYPGTGGTTAPVILSAGGTTVYWTISNQTPSGGNSAISSFVIKKPPGVAITGAAPVLSGSAATPPGTIIDTTTSPGNVKVSSFGPLVPKQDRGTHQVTIMVTLVPDDGCTNATTIWASLAAQSLPQYVVVTTGTFSNTLFAFTTDNRINSGDSIKPTSQTTTFTSSGCYKVTGAASPLAGGTVACTPSSVPSGNDSICTATATRELNNNWFVTGFSGSPIDCVRIGTTNQCKVTNVTQDTTTTGDFIQSAGTVDCVTPNNYYSDTTGTDPNSSIDPEKSYVDLDIVGSGNYGIRRGQNTDGSCNKLVDVSMTVAGNKATFLYDKSTGELAAFKYFVVFGETPVDETPPTTSWTQKRLEFCYGPGADCETNGGFPNWMPALACADDDLAPPDTVLPVIPSDAPFTDAANQLVNGGLAQYQPGVKAKACVAFVGWKSNGRHADTNKIQVIYYYKIVDKVDLSARQP